METAQTFLVGNLLPMIGNVLAGIPELVYTLVPEILQSGTQLVTSLAEGFTQGIPDFCPMPCRSCCSSPRNCGPTPVCSWTPV